MAKTKRTTPALTYRRLVRRLRAAASRVLGVTQHAAARLGGACRQWWAAHQSASVPTVQVVVSDHRRARELEQALQRALVRLRRALGHRFWGDDRRLVVVVQHAIGGDRPLAGCTLAGIRRDGSQLILVRLALQARGRDLSTDEVLAALVEQCVALTTQTDVARVSRSDVPPLDPVTPATPLTLGTPAVPLPDREALPPPPAERTASVHREQPRGFAPDPLAPVSGEAMIGDSDPYQAFRSGGTLTNGSARAA